MAIQDKSRVRFGSFVIGEGTLLHQCCEILLAEGHELLGVISAHPDVIRWAEKRRVRVLPPDGDFAAALKERPFDYLFSITNLRLLPKAVVELPRLGTINFHDGPLPRYAGVHATSWALLNREPRHGVTWHAAGEVVDGGRIYKQRFVEIAEGETAWSLNLKCFEAAVQSFKELARELAGGQGQLREQDLSQRTYFGMFQRPAAAGIVAWDKPAAEIAALVRALEFGPYPNPMGRAKVAIGTDFLLCPEVAVLPGTGKASPGTITGIEAGQIRVATADREIGIRRLLTLDGEPVALGEAVKRFALQPGARLPELGAEPAQRLSTLYSQFTKSEAFWVQTLEGLRPLSLPYLEDLPGSGRSPNHSSLDLPVPETVTRFLETQQPTWGRDKFLFSAFAVYLARLSQESRVHLGLRLPGLNRDIAGLEKLFLSRAPLPLQVDESKSILDHYAQVDAQWELVRRHKTFALDVLARYPSLHGLAGLGWSRLVPVCVETVESLEGYELASGPEFCFVIPAAGRHCRWVFNPSALSEPNAKLMRAQFTAFLEGIAADPRQPVARLPLLDEAQRGQLQRWNETAATVPSELCIHQAFEQQAARTPDAVAVVCQDQELTYAALNARANQLAAHLRTLGVGPDRVVGLSMARSVEMVVGLLGILKAGGAYLPLDPAYPRERIAFMLEDANVPVLLTQQRLAPTLPRHQAKVVCIDADWPAIARESEENVASGVAPRNLAYVIYTSGSTGKPKGVMVEHRNVVNFFSGMDAQIEHGPGSTWLAVTSLSFDISVLELFWTLARGLKVVVFAGDNGQPTSSPAPRPSAKRPIDFSLFYFAAGQGQDPANKYRLLLEGAKFADEHGFTAVWTPERHFHDFGGLYPNPSVLSAALAVLTKRVQIRSGSVVAPLHSPIRIAEEWAVVDNLSKGRVGVSFASGWMPEDFVIKPEGYASRKEAMFRDIKTVRQLWRGEAVGFPGPLGKDVVVKILPRPLQPELPVWVTTAGNPETYQMAGAAGANVLTHLLGQSLAEVAEKIAIYRKAWKKAGHPGHGRVTLMLHTFVSDSPEKVRETVRGPLMAYLQASADLIRKYAATFPAFKKLGPGAEQVSFGDLSPTDMEALLAHAFDRYFESSGLFGTPQSCVDRIDELKDSDIDEVACLIDFGVDAEVVLENLQYLDALRGLTSRPQAAEFHDPSIPGLIRRHRVTHLQCTPSLARMLAMDPGAREALGRLKQLMIGGEAFPAALAAELKGVVNGDLLNMYGPTETTIWSTAYRLNGAVRAVPIGRPIANTEIYILDPNRQALPVGVPGELMIGGAGVVRGYLNRPELTAERFLSNPFGKDLQARLYRTGDLARYLPDGNVEFLGRLDHQVKIRGHRIELGEIEALLNQHPGVSQAVVVAREEGAGEKRLVAYVTARAGRTPGAAELRAFAKEKLPDYMAPAQVVLLKAFPQTPNGKIDRKALPAPAKSMDESDRPFERPRTAIEEALAALWAETLGASRIGRRDNFFDLGGDSLSAFHTVFSIRQACGIDLPLEILFRAPTLSALAASLEQAFLAQAEASPKAADAETPALAQAEHEPESELEVASLAGDLAGVR